MFTDTQRVLFGQVLDANYDLNLSRKEGFDTTAKQEALDELKDELRASMGNLAYYEFMAKGRKMFS